MGTRGIIGFRYEEKDYLTYNHHDSYPGCLGADILEDVDAVRDPEELKEVVKGLTLVTEDDKPTKEQQDELKGWANLGVGGQSTEDWYCLLRDAQGTLEPYISGKLKYMINSNDFIKDSLFCEWGYIVNLDTMMLEVWRGFQEKPDQTNRYGQKAESGYRQDHFPCKMVRKFPLNNLPSEEQFIRTLEEARDEGEMDVLEV